MKLRQIGYITRVGLHRPSGFLLQDQVLDESLAQRIRLGKYGYCGRSAVIA